MYLPTYARYIILASVRRVQKRDNRVRGTSTQYNNNNYNNLTTSMMTITRLLYYNIIGIIECGWLCETIDTCRTIIILYVINASNRTNIDYEIATDKRQ